MPKFVRSPSSKGLLQLIDRDNSYRPSSASILSTALAPAKIPTMP